MGRGEKRSFETAEAPEKVPGETEAVCVERRRNYTSGEARRVGVSFAVAAKDAHSSVILGAQDKVRPEAPRSKALCRTMPATWSS